MINKKVAELMNLQINKEFYSAYLYLDMANFYADRNLNGFANWFNVQAQEERDHAMLFVKFLQNNNIRPELEAIAKPDKAFNELIDPLEASLQHEIYVTESIHNIYDEALKAKDFRSTQFLDWFVKEQGEEENSADELIQKYKIFGSDGKGLYLLDSELGTRVYAPPTLVLD
ncbi:MAG: ferritin [Clostridiales bacterium]|jgi:ferritin|nr:ferritin [Clostridiales bacterium]